MGMARGVGLGGSALAIQISQTGWKDVIYLSIYLSKMCRAWPTEATSASSNMFNCKTATLQETNTCNTLTFVCTADSAQ